jgi:uncharacterized protein
MVEVRPSLAALASFVICSAAAAPMSQADGPPSRPTAPAAPGGSSPLLVADPAPAARGVAIVARARAEVLRGVAYDPAYVRLRFRGETDTGRTVYPGGDLDPARGVCTDVVVRALRAVGVDLQERVHADVVARPTAYPGIGAPDANIDHRRVGPLLVYLRAHASSPPAADWAAGDVVVWAFSRCPHCAPDHIGIVSDRRGPRGLPLVIHNMGPKPTEDDVLDAWTVLGHFRI